MNFALSSLGSAIGAPPKPTIQRLGFPDECLLGPTTAVGAVCHQAPASTELQSGLFGGSERTEVTTSHLFPALGGGRVHDVDPHDDDGRLNERHEIKMINSWLGPGRTWPIVILDSF